MPTIVTASIGSDGGETYDYSSVRNWESNTQGDLVSADEIRQGIIKGTWASAETSTTSLDIAGGTTDSTRYRELIATGSAAAPIQWSTSAWRWDATDPSQFTMQEVGTRISNMQFRRVRDVDVGHAPVVGFWSGEHHATGCTIGMGSTVNHTTGNKWGIEIDGLCESSSITNCIIYSYQDLGGATWYGPVWLNTTGQHQFHNNTVVYVDSGSYDVMFAQSNGVVELKNNIFAGSSGESSDWSASSDTNVITDSGSIGSLPVTNRTTGDVQFIDTASWNFGLDPSDTVAQAQGLDLSAYFIYDLEGDDRTINPNWDIGADQQQAGPRPDDPVATTVNVFSLSNIGFSSTAIFTVE